MMNAVIKVRAFKDLATGDMVGMTPNGAVPGSLGNSIGFALMRVKAGDIAQIALKNHGEQCVAGGRIRAGDFCIQVGHQVGHSLYPVIERTKRTWKAKWLATCDSEEGNGVMAIKLPGGSKGIDVDLHTLDDQVASTLIDMGWTDDDLGAFGVRGDADV